MVHKDLAVNRPIGYSEVAAVVPKDDLSTDPLPLVGLIERLVEIAMPAECRMGDNAVKLEVVETALEIGI